MKPTPRRASLNPAPDARRKRRSRPTPKWLKEQQDLDDLARRRCLMVLSVLSGERPVTDVVQEADISRGLYYQLETRALQAMLRALAPGSELTGTPGADGMVKRISELEGQVKTLLQEKRRAERMLFLTRKMLRRGPLSSGKKGRPAKTPSSSMKPGPRPSSGSATKPASPEPTSGPPSTSTSPGESSP